MKHFISTLFLTILAAAGYSQISSKDITATDTIYVEVQTGTVNDTVYYRLATTQITGGTKNVTYSPAEQLDPFKSTIRAALSQARQYRSAITDDIRRMQSQRLSYISIVNVLTALTLPD